MFKALGSTKLNHSLFVSSRTMSKVFSPTAKIQPVTDKITTSTLFLTMTLKSPVKADMIKKTIANIGNMAKEIHETYPESSISYIVGFGLEAWQKLFSDKLTVPKDSHPFKELKGVHHAPSTPGDLFFHIRAEEMAICFEFGTKIAEAFGDSVEIVDEVHSFKYSDSRNVLGFVDGTGNPEGEGAIADATVITSTEDDKFVGGSYVITQKYFHDSKKWNQSPTEQQEYIIGRTKKTDKSLKDKKKSWSHNVLTELKDPDGTQHEIMRDNMPFGEISKGEFGTYFIGYAKKPQVTEKMLDNMFSGDPPGNYDRLLDYSKAVTGNLFFCPTRSFLDVADKF